MKKKMPPIHPGEILEEEFLKPLGITKYRISKDIGVPPQRIGEIVKGNRSITADTAIRLARYFKTSKEFWLGLQMHYDLEEIDDSLGVIIEKSIRPYDEAA